VGEWLLADPCIDPVVVYGEGRNYLTALTVPRWDAMRRALREVGTALDGQHDEALVGHRAAAALLERRIEVALRDLAP
jgi:hypothetical protein